MGYTRKPLFAGVIITIVLASIGLWFVDRGSVVLGAVFIVCALVVDLIITVWHMQKWVEARRLVKARGFEVKLTPGTMPGLIEKKEDDHG